MMTYGDYNWCPHGGSRYTCTLCNTDYWGKPNTHKIFITPDTGGAWQDMQDPYTKEKHVSPITKTQNVVLKTKQDGITLDHLRDFVRACEGISQDAKVLIGVDDDDFEDADVIIEVSG